MTDTRYAFAHGEPLMTPAPDGVDDAISAVMAKHRAELDEALTPFGVSLDDLLQPTWMRTVRMDDVQPFTEPEPLRIGPNGERIVTLSPEEAAAVTRALGIEYTIDGVEPLDARLDAAREANEYMKAHHSVHDTHCEGDFGAEGQTSPCRCPRRRAEALANLSPEALAILHRPTHLEGD